MLVKTGSPECVYAPVAENEVRSETRDEARELGDLPITVVTAGPAGRESWYPAWRELQAEFLDMSTNTAQVLARDTGHHINHDDPGLLAEIVRDAISEARTKLLADVRDEATQAWRTAGHTDSVVDELIAERRAEAAREDSDDPLG